MPYTCGLQRSSQGASALVLDTETGKVVHRDQFSYDDMFGERYPIAGGVLKPDAPGIQEGERHAPQLMLVEALDALFSRMPRDVVGNIKRYKIDDMQHALAYTKRGIGNALAYMDPRQTIAQNLEHYFSRPTTHIWEDRTTGSEVAELEERLAPYGGMIALTANPAELRFPAAQLLKWARANPEEYHRTGIVSPLSAFGTSILAGIVAPVDTGDGWGTNLNTVNINTPGWDERITQLIAPDLHLKLPPMTHYDARMGNISIYFVERYGADPSAIVLAGTGDNPAYLLGFFLSTGTSWTLNGELPEVAKSSGEDNVFGCKPGRVMSLVCFTNGGRVHEEFRDRYADGSWDRYHELAMQAEPCGNLMLPYFLAESVPRRSRGVVRDGFDEFDGPANIRALTDSMVLAARLHSQRMRMPEKILLVGGGGKNPVLRQAVADAFERPVATLEESELATVLGDAMAGAADLLNIPYLDIPYTEAVSAFAREREGSLTNPNPQNIPIYKDGLRRYAELERKSA